MIPIHLLIVEELLFIQDHLFINIGSNSELQGNIIWVDDIAQIDLLMRNKSITKLVWNRNVAINPMETHINWSYSKGDTYKECCIILTNDTSDLNAHGKKRSTKKTGQGQQPRRYSKARGNRKPDRENLKRILIIGNNR